MFGRILFGVGERLMGRFACLRRRGVYSLRSIDSPVSYLNGLSVLRGNPLRGASVDQQGKVWMFERKWLVGFSRPRAQMPLWHLLRRGPQRSIPLRGVLFLRSTAATGIQGFKGLPRDLIAEPQSDFPVAKKSLYLTHPHSAVLPSRGQLPDLRRTSDWLAGRTNSKHTETDHQRTRCAPDFDECNAAFAEKHPVSTSDFPGSHSSKTGFHLALVVVAIEKVLKPLNGT